MGWRIYSSNNSVAVVLPVLSCSDIMFRALFHTLYSGAIDYKNITYMSKGIVSAFTTEPLLTLIRIFVVLIEITKKVYILRIVFKWHSFYEEE